MAVAYPSDLIQKIKLGLRKEAGISSYDPDDAELINLPTLDEAIAALDPSPPYLRCKECHGRLLRGLLSQLCVYCGSAQKRDGPPPAISFNSTFGCRKLLEALELDGSEAIPAGTTATESTGRQNASREGWLLSDLLDMELCWPEDTKEIGYSSTDKVPTMSVNPLNLAGVDLEDFFSETKTHAPSMPDEQLMPKERVDTPKSFISSTQASVSMFESRQPSFFAEHSQVNSEGGEVGDPFSAWEAKFQSASSGAPFVDTKSLDPFLDTSTSNLAASGERTATFEPGKEIRLDVDDKLNDGQAENCLNHISSQSNSWIQDDSWHTRSAKLSTNTDQIIGNDDPLESWQDFASSNNAATSLSSWPKTGSAVNDASPIQMNPKDVNNNMQEMEFGDFINPDSFSKSLGSQKGSNDVDMVQFETSLFDRKESTEANHEDVDSQVTGKNSGNLAAESADPTVEMLISQMPDLSFMLASELTIPNKVDKPDMSL